MLGVTCDAEHFFTHHFNAMLRNHSYSAEMICCAVLRAGVVNPCQNLTY